MTDKLINPTVGDEPLRVAACRNQHQAWATTLAQHEQEIDQLLMLLGDLLDYPNYQQLRHRAVAHYGHLNHLKSRFQRLRLDMICEGADCWPSARQACTNPRFGLYTTIDSSFHNLTDEFSKVKAGCYQFLSVMVTLNLL